VHVDLDPHWVTVRVRESGDGISAELPRIFSLSRGRSVAAAGIGLAVARE